MRAAILAFLAVSLAVPALALAPSVGNLVQGKYTASGRARFAGITLSFQPSRVRITNHGRVIGYVTRVVTQSGQVLDRNVVRLRGKCGSIRVKRGAFSAKGKLRAGNAKIRGEFQGLIDSSQRLSRFFKGEISGSKNSVFKLKAR